MIKINACRRIYQLVFACLSSLALPVFAHAEALPSEHTTAKLVAPEISDANNSAPATAGTEISALRKIANFTNNASQLALQAVGMLGIHYKYGGTDPENGLDCSGLVRYVFKETLGTILPRTSAEISHVGQHIDPHQLQPGDLVFYNTLRRGFSHVGIYLGDNKFIHSPSAGGQVRIESMDLSYWKRRFNGARRIIAPDSGKEE